MSKKIKLQDLSIANFDQQPDVKNIKGGMEKFCKEILRCPTGGGIRVCQRQVICTVFATPIIPVIIDYHKPIQR